MRGRPGEQNLRGVLFTDRLDLEHGASSDCDHVENMPAVFIRGKSARYRDDECGVQPKLLSKTMNSIAHHRM
jgi:hypothetical protein